MQRGHAGAVAADEEVGAVFEPVENVAAGFAHAVLDVDFLAGNIARESDIEPVEGAFVEY